MVQKAGEQQTFAPPLQPGRHLPSLPRIDAFLSFRAANGCEDTRGVGPFDPGALVPARLRILPPPPPPFEERQTIHIHLSSLPPSPLCHPCPRPASGLSSSLVLCNSLLCKQAQQRGQEQYCCLPACLPVGHHPLIAELGSLGTWGWREFGISLERSVLASGMSAYNHNRPLQSSPGFSCLFLWL